MTFVQKVYFNFFIVIILLLRNWVFATNSVFVKPLSLQPNDVNLWYFKLTLFNPIAFIFWNIKGLRHWFATILKLENQSICHKLDFLILYLCNCYGKPYKFQIYKSAYNLLPSNDKERIDKSEGLNQTTALKGIEFLIPIPLQSDDENIRRSFPRIHSLKYQRSTKLGRKDIWIVISVRGSD